MSDIAIHAQTEMVQKQTNDLRDELYVQEQSYRYIAETRNVLRIFNTFLLFIYAFFFILIHVMYGVQYYQGIPRNELVDSVMLTVFFFYPYLIYSVEAYIFDMFAFFAKFILGVANIPSLDIFMGNLTKYDNPSRKDSLDMVASKT
jgi:hypothetical protein